MKISRYDLKHSQFLIGNSSSGIIESFIFELPVINIGKRNLNRENAGNVLFIDYNIKDISASIENVKTSEFKDKWKNRDNPYQATFKSSTEIRTILENTPIDEKLLDKKFISRNCHFEDD